MGFSKSMHMFRAKGPDFLFQEALLCTHYQNRELISPCLPLVLLFTHYVALFKSIPAQCYTPTQFQSNIQNGNINIEK